MGYRKREYLALLDRALLFAARHTGADGRMSVNGEIDCKDSGWLVLGGAVRGVEAGWRIGEVDLIDLCRWWTLASVRVDDTRSAWTTFALLYTFYLTGGNDGTFARSFTAGERAEVERFLLQIDMHYLYEASRNYRVAAAIIDALRLRFGCIERPERPIEENIDAMLSGYLGNGFFNDDDCRGSRADRRIDAYSAEIIGLLLHFDEIFHFASCRHEQIMEICRAFCRSGRYLIDADGEFAKWGRSLRGEAEVKKIFLWEFAETHHLTAQPGDGPFPPGAERFTRAVEAGIPIADSGGGVKQDAVLLFRQRQRREFREESGDGAAAAPSEGDRFSDLQPGAQQSGAVGESAAVAHHDAVGGEFPRQNPGEVEAPQLRIAVGGETVLKDHVEFADGVGDPTAVELLVFSQQAAVFDHAARQRPLIGGVNAEDMGDVADRGDVGDPEDAGVMEIRHRKPPVAERLFELCKHVVIVVAERPARPVGGEIDPRPE